MKCEKAKKWISLEMDGELLPRRANRLHAHFDTCLICQRTRNEWTSIGVRLRERHAPMMWTPDAAWAEVRRAIYNDQEKRKELGEAPVLGAPLRWAVAALLIMIFGFGSFLTFQKSPIGISQTRATQVEFVETGLPDATPMVYEDTESGWTVIWVVEANGRKEGHAGT